MKVEKRKSENAGSSALGTHIRFWGYNCLGNLGISVGAAFILFLFWGFGAGNTNDLKDISNLVGLYGYYLIIAGSFVLFLVGIAYFREYFSMLVSMNVIRRVVVWGILVSQTIMIVGILVLASVIWTLFPGDISDGGIRLVPFFAGVLLASSAFCFVLGVVISKWGKIGALIMAVIGILVGGCAGAGISLISEGTIEAMLNLLKKIGGFNFWLVTAVGMVLYAAAGIFALLAMRKVEVRA